MKEDLRILILEDLPTDAELAQRELQTVLKNCVFDVVDTEEDFVKALKDFKPDLIISDYLMPEFDGLTALKIRQDKCPTIPFVMLTGSVNEESAVECMKAGADDYVIKEHIKRLGPAAINALEKKKIEKKRKLAEREIRKLSTAVEQSPVSIVITDTDGIIEYVNPAFEKLSGYSLEETIGLYANILKSGTTADSVYRNLWETITKGKVWTGEFQNKKKNGELFWESATISPVLDSNNNIKNFLEVKEDITEKKKFIADLMEREEKYRTLTQNLNVGVYRCTPGKTGKFIESNQALLKLFGLTSKKELERFNVVDFYSDPLDQRRFEEKLVSNGFLIDEEIQLRRKDGVRFHGSISTTIAKDDSGKVIHFDGIIEDRTEKQKNQEAILIYQSNLKSLTNDLYVTEEKVKRNLAITLHDKLGQLLIAIKYKISELNNKVEKAEHKQIIDEISKVLKDTIKESRNITYELSPPVLYEMGLVSAISWKLEDIEKNKKIKTSLTDESNSYKLEEKIEIIIYRVISELLQNVLKHAKAKNVTITLKLLPNSFIIAVKDNGIGFDLNATKNRAVAQKKFGLFSIMERIRYIGGEMTIKTALKKGTEAVIKLPLKN
ncbi:MAG: PAS domain S-box protein [Candidatus Neomarinimicrobiota bacterium]